MLIHAIAASILTFSFACSAGARTRIDDPKAVMPASDQFIGSISFQDAYHEADRAITESNDCSATTCKTTTQEVTVASVTPTEAVLIQMDDDGKTNSSVVQATDYASIGPNPLRQAFEDLAKGYDDYIVVDSAEYDTFAIPSSQTVPSMRVFFSVHYFNGYDEPDVVLPMVVTLGQGLPRIGQILQTELAPMDPAAKPLKTLVSVSRSN
jgi:hypothetical protein